MQDLIISIRIFAVFKLGGKRPQMMQFIVVYETRKDSMPNDFHTATKKSIPNRSSGVCRLGSNWRSVQLGNSLNKKIIIQILLNVSLCKMPRSTSSQSIVGKAEKQ